MPLPPVPDAFGFAGAFAGTIGNHLLAGGGANFPDGVLPWDGGKKVWHDTLFALDLANPDAGWNVIGKLPEPNGYGVSLTAPEGILIAGGGDAARNFKKTWLLTLSGDGKPEFKKLPDLPTGLAQMCGTLVGRRVHLCGGIAKPDSATATIAHLELDLDALEKGWQNRPPLPAAGRILAAAASIDGAFFVFGGCALNPDDEGNPVRAYLRDAWKFSADRWSRVADLPFTLAACASPAPVTGHAAYLISGDDGSQANLADRSQHKGFSKKVLRYDAAADSWSVAGELGLPPPVTVAIAPWNDSAIFFNGEVKPGVRTNAVFTLSLPPDE